MSQLIGYLFTFFASSVLTWMVRSVARKREILDHPNERSSHTVPTPRGGGIAIVAAFYGALLLFLWAGSDSRIVSALWAGLPLAVVGLLDDLYDLSASLRFMIQICSAVLAIWFLEIPPLFWLPALLLIVWFTNLFNFLDGIDGYLSAEVLFLSLAGYWFFHEPLLLFLGAAVAGFLPFNWQRATIFMGDTGSTVLGFSIALFILFESHNFKDLLIWMVLTMPFWFDATYTLVRRILNGEKVTQAHRKHLFQRTVRYGLSHRQVVYGLLLIDLLLSGLLLLWRENLWFVVVTGLLAMTLITYLIEKRVPFDAK